LALPEVQQLAEQKGLTPQTYMFAFLMSLGYVTPLSGTTNTKHMAEDVAVMERMQGGEQIFESEEELRHMAQLLGMPDL
jgi:aryl-alcohol dehydrogenase-like predicted oxidoreductase